MIKYRAKSDRRCVTCKSIITAGSVYYGFRERAVSYNEAMHAGTMYPKRHRCLACGNAIINTRPATDN